MKFSVSVAAIVSLLIVAAFDYAQACSVCMCGDNLFSMSQQSATSPLLFHHGDLRMNFQTIYTSKSNALGEEEGPGTERQREFRPALKVSYGIADGLSASAQIPLSFKRIEIATSNGRDRQSSSGFGDAEISAVWTMPIARSASSAYLVGLANALKLPTGTNSAQRLGQRVDEHLQSGTGSYDWQTGIAIGQTGVSPAFHASLYYRSNGTNSHDYHFGNALLYNVGVQGRMSSGLTLTAEINGRFAKQDTEAKTPVENTGGSVVYCTPGLKILSQRSVNLLVSVQVPVYQNLYGTQSERAVLNAGFSLDVL